MCSTHFCTFPFRIFARLQRCFARLKRETSWLHYIFITELSYVLTKNLLLFLFVFTFPSRSFSPCWPLAFLFFSPPEECLTAATKFLFLFHNEIRVLCFTRSSSFSDNHVSVDTKSNVEKRLDFVAFSL